MNVSLHTCSCTPLSLSLLHFTTFLFITFLPPPASGGILHSLSLLLLSLAHTQRWTLSLSTHSHTLTHTVTALYPSLSCTAHPCHGLLSHGLTVLVYTGLSLHTQSLSSSLSTLPPHRGRACPSQHPLVWYLETDTSHTPDTHATLSHTHHTPHSHVYTIYLICQCSHILLHSPHLTGGGITASLPAVGVPPWVAHTCHACSPFPLVIPHFACLRLSSHLQWQALRPSHLSETHLLSPRSWYFHSLHTFCTTHLSLSLSLSHYLVPATHSSPLLGTSGDVGGR